jgi:hypothetical protein
MQLYIVLNIGKTIFYCLSMLLFVLSPAPAPLAPTAPAPAQVVFC